MQCIDPYAPVTSEDRVARAIGSVTCAADDDGDRIPNSEVCLCTVCTVCIVCSVAKVYLYMCTYVCTVQYIRPILHSMLCIMLMYVCIY